jgi:hypothetical protein
MLEVIGMICGNFAKYTPLTTPVRMLTLILMMPPVMTEEAFA